MADATAQAIVKNEQYSVRQFSPSSWGGMIGGDHLGFLWPSRADMLPPWGTTSCDIALRVMHYTQHNALWGGAAKVWTEKVLSTPYEISGGRNLTFQWQDLFFESDFGEGYDYMLSKVITDYLTLNRGGFIEKVSYGEPDTPLQEGAKILGLNHLDALRIIFTGNREWPYLYQSEWGGELHKLHTTRVIRLTQSPSPNTLVFGMGKSALYDALTVSNMQVMLGRHQNELLNDLPPPGIVIFNNVKADEVQTAMTQFEYERVRDGQSIYRAPLSMSSKDPSQPATVTFVPLSTVPEGFDYQQYMETHVNLLALTMQLDPQDIWPLQSKALGSGMQSEVLQKKTSSKGPGYFLIQAEREFNKTLPRSLEWKYKAPNAEADKQIADTAAAWSAIADSATYMNADEKRQLVANQVPAFADVLMDEEGQVRLFDADPKEPTQIFVAADAVEMDTPDDDAEEVTANSENESVMIDAPVTKDIDATGDAFVADVQAAIEDGISRTVTKAGTAARIRGAIQRFVKLAYQDGLEAGGVDKGELDEDDKLAISDLALHNSQYVTNLVNEIYSEAGLSGTAENRAKLWVSSTNEAYYAGIASADASGMYEFVGDDGVENCKTCKALKGQKHRMKDWMRRKLIPGKDHSSFECGTWEPNCAHYLEKTTGKAQGSWV